MEKVWPIICGRWQPFHKGHLWIAKRIIEQYGRLIISIANPDPLNPPDPNFDRFFSSANPLTFWDRQYILNHIFKAEDLLDYVRVVPAWHPRVRIDCEDFCLPPKQHRVWIVPITSDEEEKKVQDFKDRGEQVVIMVDIPSDILKYSAVNIRQMVLTEDSDWQNHVPSAFLPIAEQIDFINKIKTTYMASGILR